MAALGRIIRTVRPQEKGGKAPGAGRRSLWSETAARWLRILCRAKILREVTKGGPGTMKASRYHYQPLPPQAPALAQAA